jgi:hypothetical protein
VAEPETPETPETADALDAAARPAGFRLGAECLRLALAFLAYLALFPLWRASGMFDLYAGIVLASAGTLSRACGFLGPGRRIAADALPNLESALVFVIALALVASRLPLAARLRRYGVLLAAILALNIVCLMIDVAVAAARPSFPIRDGAIRVPAAYVALEIPHFALHVGALKAWPFVAAVLTVAWNRSLLLAGGASPVGRPSGAPAPPAAPPPPRAG